MMAFRFVTVLILSFLLLSPFIKTVSNYIEKPLIIIAQDNSASVMICKDSTLYRGEYRSEMEKLISRISVDFDVKTFSFGDKPESNIKWTFNDKQTDISELFNDLKNKYANKNVGAVVLATDGLYNKGSNPAYLTKDINYPVYPIAMGDTAIQKDQIISKVNYNKIAFLGNKFPIEINVDIRKLPGISTQMNVYNNGQKVFTKQIITNSDSYKETITMQADAVKSGLQHFKIEIIPVQNEISTSNNYKDIVIDVIDSKQKVLILANAPHPDIAALRNALATNQNLQVDFFTADKFTGNLTAYNLIILHQLPSKNNSFSTELSQIISKTIPVLYIIGGQSSLENINNIHSGFTIRQSRNSFDESQGFFNKQFSLFQISAEMQDFISKTPPLITPFGDYKYSDNQSILLFQKISSVTTSRPLILFNINTEGKSGFITGEGLWRWRMMDYVLYSNHELFDELINKITQYLALKINKESFIVNTKKVINENEPLPFDAEVYNESYELINSQEVSVEITNSQHNKFSYIFEKSGNAYHLNAGIFPTGDYSWTAKTIRGKKDLLKNGKFTVVPMNVEGENTIADYQLLHQLATATNGKVFIPSEVNKIYENIKSNSDIVPISYAEKQMKELISFKWIFILILTLISTEWFCRKYFGGY